MNSYRNKSGIRRSATALLTVFFILTSLVISAQTTSVTISTQGASKWTVPAGVTQITVECWGGGGAGGYTTGKGDGGGGAGGSYVRSIITVTPGQVFDVFVAPVKPGTSTGGVQNGNNTWFNNSGYIRADGGQGGGIANNSYGTGGLGSVANPIGQNNPVIYRGGNGTTGTVHGTGGAGGGGAGSSGNGSPASGASGGTATPDFGGSGASIPAANNEIGNPGSSYGGGGSGGRANGNTGYAGGSGAQGLIRITYNSAALTISAVSTPDCSNSPAPDGSITVTAGGGTPPYTYRLNAGTWQSANIFSPVLAGTYNVSVKDAANVIATTTSTVQVSTSAMPAIQAQVTNANCSAATGAVKILNIPTSLAFTKAESDYVDLGGSLLNNLPQFTIEGWIKIDKSQVSGERTWGLFGQNDAIEFGIMNSTTLQLWSSGGGTLNVSMANYPSDNGWHHIAGTGSGTAMKIYIDGVEIGNLNATVSNYGSSTYNTVLGGHVWDATGNYFNGSMLKVSFRSVALTQQQILTLAQSKFTEYSGSEPGMLAGFNFFEGAGTTMNSVGSLSAITGNLINSPAWVEVFTYAWTKTDNPAFTATSKNISSLSEGEYTLNASFPGICTLTGTWTVGLNGLNQWTGTTSNDWNTLTNWTCGIPDLSIDANIPTGLTRYPLLKTGVAGMCKNLVIGAGASVTVEGNTLQIAGDIQSSGIITATAGTIEFRGSSQQTIPAGAFATNTIQNLTVNNSANVLLNGTLKLTGILKAQTGNFITNGFLTLESTATGTALIDGTGSGQLTGNVIMQRYLPAAYGYKYFSSPFSDARVSQFADDVDLNASFATFYSYTENKVSTGWDKYINPTALLLPGNGYAANFGTTGGIKTVTTTGTVNNGNIGPIAVSNNNQPYTKGYNLVGNPYPSPIDWNAAGWSRTNIDNAIYFFDAGITDQYLGTYSSYVNGISSDGKANNIIASQQAFFIHVKDGTYPVNGSITFTNQVRTTGLNPLFHKKEQISQDSFIRLLASMSNDGAHPDYTVAYFTPVLGKEFNPDVDALKIKNTETGVPNIWIITEDNRETSVKAVSNTNESRKIINLGVSSATAGNLVIRAKDISNISEDYFIYLKDNYTGKIQDLRITPEYRFDIKNEVFTDRFTLILSTEKIEQQVLSSSSFNAFVRDGSVMIHLNLKEEQVTARITDISGRVLLEKQVYGEGDHRIGQLSNTGIYIVSLYTDMGIISRKIYL